MARIQPSNVLDGGFDADLTDAEVGDVINDAHLVVAEDLEGEGLYSAGRLDQIEKYLTRHLIRVGPDRQIESGKGASTQIDFSGDFDAEGLAATAPGQRVMTLDEESALGDSRPQADFEVF